MKQDRYAIQGSCIASMTQLGISGPHERELSHDGRRNYSGGTVERVL